MTQKVKFIIGNNLKVSYKCTLCNLDFMKKQYRYCPVYGLLRNGERKNDVFAYENNIRLRVSGNVGYKELLRIRSAIKLFAKDCEHNKNR
ncbi:MAG: hypothetical protein K2I81_02725 [Alphaproteobacteria bacterium]|nr:hypothetical protein [Alphaproteobacteria bacterium]